MKYTCSATLMMIMMAGLLLVVAACKKNAGGSSAGGRQCKILRKTDSSWGNVGLDIQDVATTNFQYDDMGNEVNISYAENTKYSDGSFTSSVSSSGLQYDDHGFRIRELGQSNYIDRSGVSTSSSYTFDYQFDQGRLVKRILNSVSGVQKQSDVSTYIYDPGDNLIKYIDSTDGVFDDMIQYDYSNGKLFKVASHFSDGTTVMPYIELNSQGLFTKTINDGDEYRYQYDAEGNLIRSENWYNGAMVSATVFEYDHQKNPLLLQYPQPKGFPGIQFITLEYHYPSHNYSRTIKLIANASGQWIEKSHDIYNYTYNSKGYPETIERQGFDVAGNKIYEGGKTVFTYADCD